MEFGFSAQTAFVQGITSGCGRACSRPRGWTCAWSSRRRGSTRGLAHKKSTKDESRAGGRLFPSTTEQLRRKKDHGRAEALLIAAYGHVAASARGERDANDETLKTERAGASWRARSTTSDAGFTSSVGAGRASRTPCALVREVVVRSVAERAAEAAEDGDDAPEADATLRRALGPDDPLPYFGPYFGMSGKQLAAEARARSLKVSGKKMELVARLEMDDAEKRRG